MAEIADDHELTADGAPSKRPASSVLCVRDDPMDESVAEQKAATAEIRRLGDAYLADANYRAELDRRASADWMHAFLFAFDEADMQVDLLALLRLVEDTYAPLLNVAPAPAGSPPVPSGRSSVAALVLETYEMIREVDDRAIKQFEMLFVMGTEQAARVAVCSRCVDGRTDRLMQWLKTQGIFGLRNCKFNEFNAVEVVQSFLGKAALQYAVGRTDTAADRAKARTKRIGAPVAGRNKRSRRR